MSMFWVPHGSTTKVALKSPPLVGAAAFRGCWDTMLQVIGVMFRQCGFRDEDGLGISSTPRFLEVHEFFFLGS